MAGLRKKRKHYRLNTFFYIEVYDIAALRSKKLNKVMGLYNNIRPTYFNTLSRNTSIKNIYLSSFWKKKQSAINQKAAMKERCDKKNLTMEIIEINRLEFIKLIPLKVPECSKWDMGLYIINIGIVRDEKAYMETLKCREIDNINE